ncbi:MAG TPA: hypothetical protein VLT79_06020 [Gemmatimonadales bacterium]|nr:hypothetical protein [Gemmatimonadales bacterium]
MNRRARTRCGAALLLGLVTGLMPVPRALPAQSVRARLEGRVPATSIPVIDSLIREAGREGLPTDLLVQKAIEGGAKHVSGERIVKAVELNIDQLRRAQALLVSAGDTPPVTPSEVAAVVWARKRGLDSMTVTQIVSAIPDERRGAALHAVADLVAHHFPADSAADLILAAVRQGMHGGRLLDVSYAAVQELQRGHSHSEALAMVQHQLPNVPAQPTPPKSSLERARRPLAASHGEPATP